MSIYAELKEKFKKENSIIRTVKNKDNPYVMINYTMKGMQRLLGIVKWIFSIYLRNKQILK